VSGLPKEKIMDPNILEALAVDAESRRLWTSHETPGAYERRPCPGAPWTSLDETALATYFAKPDWITLAALEGLIVRRDSALQPAVAGYALFGVHPELQRPAWRVVAEDLTGLERPVRSGGTRRLETEGPAPQAIAQVEAFLWRNLRLGRPEEEEAPEYPLAAVLEAVANAVAHRDYAAASPVFVRLYDDRIEIESPGGLLPGLTLEGLLAGGESHPRNPVIAGALRRMGLMAEAGRGLALIQREMAGLGSPPPEFAADAHSFRVTLPNRW
jgi:ATP-dependent DNA helicase RecG